MSHAGLLSHARWRVYVVVSWCIFARGKRSTPYATTNAFRPQIQNKTKHKQQATMTDNQTIPTVKRVMSKDCLHEDMPEEKKSKMEGAEEEIVGFTADDSAAGLKQLILDDHHPADVHDELNNDEGDTAPLPDVNIPVANITHVTSHTSTTHSSLSDEEVVDDDDYDNKSDVFPPALIQQEGGMTRRVSNDDSLATNGEKSINSDSGTSEGNQGNSVGNWGWFDDVHGHESAFLPDMAGGGNRRGSANGNNRGNNTPDNKKKKGGLFHIGSELMQNVIQAIVEPHRQGEFSFLLVALPWWIYFCLVLAWYVGIGARSLCLSCILRLF